MSINNRIVTTYTKSLFQSINSSEISKENFEVSSLTSTQTNSVKPNIYVIGEELSLLKSILISSTKMNTFFNNPTYAEQQKLNVILSIFPGLTNTTKSFLKVLTERSHLCLLPEINDGFTKLVLKFKNTTNVKLVVASALQKNSGKLLLQKLKDLTNSTEIILNLSYNPKLLGGLILEYNSSSIDASILKEFSLFFNEN